jgi:hypothetical protein
MLSGSGFTGEINAGDALILQARRTCSIFEMAEKTTSYLIVRRNLHGTSAIADNSVWRWC